MGVVPLRAEEPPIDGADIDHASIGDEARIDHDAIDDEADIDDESVSPETTETPAEEPTINDLTAPDFEAVLGQLQMDGAAVSALLYEALEDVIDENFLVAIPKLETVLLERPTSMPAWESLGWSYWKLGRRDEARRLWYDLITLNPNIPQPYNFLAMAAAAEDDLEKAAKYYRHSLELAPEQFQARLALARIYRWRGQLDESIAILEPLLAEDPDRLDVRLELARAQLQNWQFEDAAPHWRVLLDVAPNTLEYQLSMAQVHMNNDEIEQAAALTDIILSDDPENIDALNILADLQEYGENPPTAIPTLRKLIELEEDPALLHQNRTRLVRLFVRLYRQEPIAFPLVEAIQITRDMVEADPLNTDTRLLLGELNSMQGLFSEAERHLKYVLEYMNPNNQRARRGLFEVYLGQRNHSKAWEQFEYIRDFNPDDPYLYYRLARYYAGRARFFAAYEALDELERRGRQGAVAVLLYHAISPSDWTSTPSVRRLYEQLKALQEAGYTFITVEELPAYLAGREAEPDNGEIEKVVMVTFDDALRSSMKYGTQVAEQLDIRLSQFVITGFTERGDPFVSTWDELREWQQTGRWSFQSQLYLAEQRSPINAEGYLGLPLANRLWLKNEGRLETQEEYEERIHFDYQHSRDLLHQNLGTNGVGLAVAYPLGELGQETSSNVDNAIPHNLAVGATVFQHGFIQTPHGHAVYGNHPFLQQRHELHRSAEGPEALAQVMENHPVLLAERMRAEFAALEGRTRRARNALQSLRDAGYPEESMERVETYVNDRMARRFAAPTAAERADRGHFVIDPSDPFLGADTVYFRDSLGRRNWEQALRGGFNLTPRLTLEGRVGYGEMRQDTTRPPVQGEPQPRVDLKVEETHVGLRAAYVISDRTMLAAEARQRDFSGDADWNLFAYALEAFYRPFLNLDTFFRYEHNAVPSAFSVTERVSYDLFAANGIIHFLDGWDIWLSLLLFDFSDDNDRLHFTLANQFEVWERIGLLLGVRYGYITADEERFDYWTPYQLHRFYVEALLRRNYFRVYYNIGARVGVGRQSVRPEARAGFAEAAERAARLQFDPGDEPSAGWEPILGLFASTRFHISGNWRLNGEIGYSKLPDYYEWNMNAGIQYRF